LDRPLRAHHCTYGGDDFRFFDHRASEGFHLLILGAAAGSGPPACARARANQRRSRWAKEQLISKSRDQTNLSKPKPGIKLGDACFFGPEMVEVLWLAQAFSAGTASPRHGGGRQGAVLLDGEIAESHPTPSSRMARPGAATCWPSPLVVQLTLDWPSRLLGDRG